MNQSTVGDICAAIEAFAPLATQAEYDNAGLLVGHLDDEVRGVLIAVDLTEDVIKEALSLGANMIVTHHPIIFNPLRRLTFRGCVERTVELSVRNNIAIYAAHTNLDCAEGGMSWRLGEILGLQGMKVLDAEGYGVVGDLEQPQGIDSFMECVASQLHIPVVRHSDIVCGQVRRVAICTGSGGSLLSSAVVSGADVYVTSDLRYNDFFAAQGALTLLDVGHYESEYCAIDLIFDILSKKMFNFALHKSLRGSNPVHYRVHNK